MAGGTTVAIFPTETASTVAYVLEHSGASLLFVGKLDTWEQQKSGVPTGLPCIAFPLAPQTDLPKWYAGAEKHRAPERQCQACAHRHCPADVHLRLHRHAQRRDAQFFERATAASNGFANYIRRELGADAHRFACFLTCRWHIFSSAPDRMCVLGGGVAAHFLCRFLDTFLVDLNRARPTCFVSVPRLWLKFQQGVFAKMPPKNSSACWVFLAWPAGRAQGAQRPGAQ
jgi:long-chain acyl-CoA synthetase